jgi:signal transduction histidine kinase
VSRRPQLTIRARLTLLNTCMFALCGAIVVVVSYVLVARVGVPYHGPHPSGSELTRLVAQCKADQIGAFPDKPAIAGCVSYLEQQGAERQHNLTLSRLLQYSVITVAAVIALAALLGWIAAGRALRPVHRITRTARAASADNLSARVAPSGPRDELRELAETFDEMLARLELAFESQRRFIANASHELRTPLAVMRTTIDVVADNPQSTPEDLLGMATDVRAAVDHAEQLIAALLILARNERGLAVHEPVDLATVAEDVLDSAEFGDLRLHLSLEPATTAGDPVLVERLLANLVDNAVRYNTTAGEVWVSTGVSQGSCQLTVANTGPIVSAIDADRILQPFQRLEGRSSHNGYGLGLTIVCSIAATHGAVVAVQPRDGGGLAVAVRFAAADVRTRTPDTAPLCYGDVTPEG